MIKQLVDLLHTGEQLFLSAASQLSEQREPSHRHSVSVSVSEQHARTGEEGD
jgi:hypothetical protein